MNVRTLKNRLTQIERALAALRPARKVLQVIVDQGADAEEIMQAALAEHVARCPEDAGRAVADFDWVTRAVLPDPRELPAVGPALPSPIQQHTNDEAAN
jgi:hypothetical protein